MGYYMRYIITAAREITLAMLDSALRQIDPAYWIVRSEFDEASGDLMWGDQVCGIIELNRPGDGIFEEDIAELSELVQRGETPAQKRVLNTLKQARAMIAVEALWEGGDSETTLEKIDSLWDWLFEHYDGLLQADNEGFYDRRGLILELNLKI